MVTEALSSEETTVEVAITAVSGLSSYFSAVVALAVEAAITAADVAAAADLHFYGILFLPVLLFFFELFKDFTFALHPVLFDAFFIYLVYVVTIYDKHISFFNNICCKHA